MRESWRSSFKAALKVLAVALLPAFAVAPALAANPDLVVTKDGPSTIAAGDDITYTVVVTNMGDGFTDEADPATNAVMTDPLPGGLTFVSLASPAGWNCLTPTVGDSGTVSCTIGSMDEGPATFTIVARVDALAAPGTSFTNIATASWSCPDQICDPSEENNSGVAFSVIPAPAADLGVTISGPDNALADADVTYSLTLVSGGPDTANQAHWSATLPGDMTFVSLSSSGGWSCTTPAVGGGGAVDCTAATLAPGAVDTFTMVGHVPPTAVEGTQYQVTAVTNMDTDDANSENDSSTTMLFVQGSADVAAVVSGPATANLNDTLTYIVTATNFGPSSATNTVLTDNLPTGLAFSSISVPSGWSCSTPAVGSSGSIFCSSGEFQPGASPTITITAQAILAGSITNAVSISSVDGDPDGNNNSSSAVTSVNGGAPSVTLTSSANPAVFGADVTLTATVPGTGATPTGTVTFLDGATTLASAPLSGGVATLTTSSLAIGDHNITVQYAGDAFYSASSSSVLIEKIVPPGAMSLDIGFGADGFVSAGETIEVLYTLTNIGNVAITGISVADSKAAGISCPVTDLAAGASTTCTGSYAVSDADVTAGSITFEATASGNGGAMATSTASISAGAAIVAQTFETMTRGFVETRQKLIGAALETPGLNDRRDRSSISVAENEGQAVLNFTASSADLWDRGPGAALAGDDASPFTFWVDGTLTVHTRSDADGTFGLVGVGADYLVSDDLLAGVALYLDFMRDVGDTGEVTGNGALVGPYISVGLADGLTLDAGLYYGHSWNEASAEVLGADYAGSFETERFIAEVELEGEWLLDQFTLRPSASAFLSNETADDYTVTNGMGGSVDVSGFSMATLRLGTGLSVERTFQLDDGLDLTPEVGARVGLGGSGEELAIDSTYASLTGGLTLRGEGWSLRSTLDLGADTGGLATASFRAGLNGNF